MLGIERLQGEVATTSAYDPAAAHPHRILSYSAFRELLEKGSDATFLREMIGFAAERLDYFHIELDSHDVLLAEGAASESYLDDDSRGMFHNAAEVVALYPGAPTPGSFCAPKVD